MLINEITIGSLNLTTLVTIISIGTTLMLMITKRSLISITTISAIFSCFALMISERNLLSLVIALEGYNICYILFLFINRVNRVIIKRLILLSMLVFSIMAFGLCTLKLYPSSIFGELLILTGLLFKLGVVPFHTWVFDVYENTSLRIIAITESVIKINIAIVFVNKLLYINAQIISIFIILGYISIIFSAIMAIYEHNAKRWLASLSAGHIGILMCTAGVQQSTSIAALVYLISYGICIMVFGISKNIIIKIIALFAMVGLPPFHTFFAKINLINTLMSNNCICSLWFIILYFVFELMSAVRWIKYFYTKTHISR